MKTGKREERTGNRARSGQGNRWNCSLFRLICSLFPVPCSLLLFVALLLYGPRLAYDCGPYADQAFFTYSIHPDLPLDAYARGRLGILEFGYARSYLYVAYRYLSGLGLNAGEQSAVVALWNARMGNPLRPSDQKEASPLDQSIKQWLDAHGMVEATTPSEIEAFASAGNYQAYLNCTPDAFVTAAHTLDGLISRFGAAADGVKDWVDAQDQVFSNCQGGQGIPEALSATAPALLRADRAYQIAAANFYAGRFDEARQRFEAIAQDSSSPWRQIARLLAARSLIRQATLSIPEPGKVDAAKAGEAEQKLRQILADPGMSELHPAADRLLGFVELRLHPVERCRELAARLVTPNSAPTIAQDLWDYTVLLESYAGGDRSADEEARALSLSGNVDTLTAKGGTDDLTDWILTFRDHSPEALAHSLDRWQSTHSLPWLVAAISKAGAETPALPQLLAAADEIKPAWPGFETVTFHALRLRSGTGHSDAVRSRLDLILAKGRGAMPPSALNLFLALRMKVATSLDEWLKYAVRVPAAEGIDTEGRELPDTMFDGSNGSKTPRPRLDADATQVLNQMLPVNVLEQAARSKALPQDLRAQVALSAWVRASLLGKNRTADRWVRDVEEVLPQLSRDLEDYRQSPTPEALRFSAALTMLRNPGISPIVEGGVGRTTPVNRIDDFRDNWWCPLAPPAANPAAPDLTTPYYRTYAALALGPPLSMLYPAGKPSAPLFVNAAQKTAAAEEWKKLQEIDAGPDYLSRVVLEWAQGHVGDPRVPEALALAVRSTRYGCTDKQTSHWSKQAFLFLHQHYPTSEWATKTKYYF
jgi:hypothetical protein